MSGNLNFTLLPTAQDIIQVKNEICTTEKNLRNAHKTIAELDKELTVLKAWIAPIRRLNTDILSLIFEICGQDDWKTPLQISATSRDWRNLVLSTPRAWEFLYVEECENIETTKLYLERSKPRPLHLYLPRYFVNDLLSSVSQRLECLTIDRFHDEMTELLFPKLTRLVIIEECDIRLSHISIARFPALRHLLCADYVTPLIDADYLNLPPLLSLACTLDSRGSLVRVLQACKDTLISLKLNVVEHPEAIQETRVVFPQLICLHIEDWTQWSGGFPLDLKTPVLETYIEDTSNPYGSLMHSNATTITQLRMNRVPKSPVYPRLNLIQLFGEEIPASFLRHLSSNPAQLPELEIIETDISEAPNDMVELVATVNGKRERAISLVSTTKFQGLRGMVQTQLCGPDMPCYYEW